MTWLLYCIGTRLVDSNVPALDQWVEGTQSSVIIALGCLAHEIESRTVQYCFWNFTGAPEVFYGDAYMPVCKLI